MRFYLLTPEPAEFFFFTPNVIVKVKLFLHGEI